MQLCLKVTFSEVYFCFPVFRMSNHLLTQLLCGLMSNLFFFFFLHEPWNAWLVFPTVVRMACRCDGLLYHHTVLSWISHRSCPLYMQLHLAVYVAVIWRWEKAAVLFEEVMRADLYNCTGNVSIYGSQKGSHKMNNGSALPWTIKYRNTCFKPTRV